MLKGAIVGFGKIARTNHLVAFRSEELKTSIDITSAVESNANTRENCKKEYNEINFYESLDKMFETEKINFIDITTPPKYHKEIIEWAIYKGIHIICEKPFTTSYAEATELYKTLIEKNILFVPCHQYKYSPLWGEFKSFVDELNDNERIFLQFNVFRTGADPGLSVNLPPWRLNKEISGGGILSDTGFHYLYLSNWLLGKPLRVTTVNQNLAHNQYQVEDTSQIILEYQQGIIQINLSWAYHSRRNEAKLISKSGSLFYDGDSYIIKTKNEKSEKISVPDASDKSHYTNLYIKLFSDFTKSVQNKNFHKKGLEDAYNTIYLLDKCYQSACKNKTIELYNE
ncbi:MAG: Gfo/Idh/MocA family protein [Melioribacter sp.]|uniref:Gfo/Idh/MocA family protein n=1 Tax=Melioribacter sp. TaxID=2052167 RepID=UPI003BDFE987